MATFFTKLLVGIGMLAGSLFGHHAQSPLAGSVPSFTPIQSTQFYLAGSGVTNVQNTITLQSFTTPDGRAITTAMTGGILYGVLDPNSPSKIENTSCTGVTQNSNGTATLTGCLRGLDFIYPYAASSTLAYSHSGGAYFILSNSAAFYGQQFALQGNYATITAPWIFGSTTPPEYDSVAAQGQGTYIATTSEFASVAYVNAISTSGAPNASASVKGIVQIATAIQTASGTATGSTGALLVIPASLGTSTPDGISQLSNVITLNDQKISPVFLNGANENYTFAGATSFSSLTATTSASGNFQVRGISVLYGTTSTLAVIATSTTATSTFAGNLTIANNASTTNLTVSGKCVGCTLPTIVNNSGSLLTNNGGITSVTASCPAGKDVSGGSWSATTIIGEGTNIYSAPQTLIGVSSWAASTTCTTGSACTSGTFSVQAICINP